MKELFEKLTHVKEMDKGVLLDTCFFFDVFRRENEKKLKRFCEDYDTLMTSFNALEVIHNNHHVGDDIRHRIHKFLHNNDRLRILEIEAFPGDWDSERRFVNNISNELLKMIPDPSDAVLAAAAIQTNSSIITRDKHHLFTTSLENFFNERGVKVYNNFF